MIKNTAELRAAIKDIQRQASQTQPKPSRVALAQSLDRLAEDLFAAPRKKAPKQLPKRELVNIGKTEQEGLSSLKRYIGYAVDAVQHEFRDIEDRIRENVADGYSPESAKTDAEQHIDVSEVIDNLERGVGYLAMALGKIEDQTGEKDLTKAAETFEKAISGSGDRVGETKVEELKPAINMLLKAQDAVPEAITGPGALRKLQESFNLMAEVCSSLGKKKVSAPKVPNALDPEDPRQLGFGFSASTDKIREAKLLCAALEEVINASQQKEPSRQVLATRLAQISAALR